MISRQQMFPAVLYPTDGPPEAESCGTEQKIIGIQLAANTEPASDITTNQINLCRFEPKRLRDQVSVGVRTFGRTV